MSDNQQELDLHVDVETLSPSPAPVSPRGGARRRNGASVSPTPSTDSNGEKKYFCQRCLNHDMQFPRKGHKPYCLFASCTCEDCSMVEQRRQLNNMLSKERIPTKARETVGGKKIRDPQCARCGAHGIRIPLRGHKKNNCQFKNCSCQLCGLVMNRRHLMAKQIKLRRDQQKQRNSTEGRQSVDSLGESHSSGTESCEVSPSPPCEPAPAPIRSLPFYPIAPMSSTVFGQILSQITMPSMVGGLPAPRPIMVNPFLNLYQSPFARLH